MLSDEERREIDNEIRRYADKRAAGIEALKIVQRRSGWVSDDDLRDVAAYLEMQPAEVDSVATFYNRIFRQPVGRHVILLCDSVSCWIMGYEAVREHLKSRLGTDFGGTSGDNRFTLLPIPCLGACDKAPAMLLNNTLYEDLTPEKIDAILDRYE